MNNLSNNALAIASIVSLPTIAHAQAKAAPPPEAPAKTVISSEELHQSFVVHGPLGRPLGDVFTVSGEAVRVLGKGDLQQFQVTSIEGKALDAPITMPYRVWGWSDIKKLTPGERYILRVYQDGGFTGVPGQAMTETTFVQTTAYNFVTNLVVVRNAANDAKK